MENTIDDAKTNANSIAVTIKALREIGDMQARKMAKDQGEDLKVVRATPIYMHEAWEWLKKEGMIPKRTAIREFRNGWRGDIGINHGTVTGYNKGCRCEVCKKAASNYHKIRYEDKKPKQREVILEAHQKLRQRQAEMEKAELEKKTGDV